MTSGLTIPAFLVGILVGYGLIQVYDFLYSRYCRKRVAWATVEYIVEVFKASDNGNNVLFRGETSKTKTPYAIWIGMDGSDELVYEVCQNTISKCQEIERRLG